MGDYDRFARATVWELGPRLVDACGIRPGHRVLDVAAGTGNVAIRAAMKGASVVACDLTPELFARGRRGAAAAGVNLEWIEGDAEALPFDDSAFDVVTSCFGAMFAPDHRAVADELVRVCRPGGTIGLVSFTPEGTGGEFFALLAPYAPAAPEGSTSPVLWGSEQYGTRAVWQPGQPARPQSTYVHRACAQPQGLLPPVHGSLWPSGRDSREPRREPGAADRTRSAVPRSRHSLERWSIDWASRDCLRVSVGDRHEDSTVGPWSLLAGLV